MTGHNSTNLFHATHESFSKRIRASLYLVYGDATPIILINNNNNNKNVLDNNENKINKNK